MSFVAQSAAAPNQNPPDTKGMPVKQVIKAEVEHALDVLAHNPTIPWASPFSKVTAALGRALAIIEASGRESFGVLRAESSTESEHKRAALQWREKAEAAAVESQHQENRASDAVRARNEALERAEKAERERDSARIACGAETDRADKAERDFEEMRKVLSLEVEKTKRLTRELERAPTSIETYKRALEKARPIVDAMLEHFKAARAGEEGDPGVVVDADGVAYGEKIGIGELRYGDLEVASGAMGVS